MRTPADRQRLTASTAILAVLLLFVAPMVSKNLAEHHASLQRLAATSGDMPMMDHHSDMPMAGHDMMAPGFACGYCDLLIHVPLMLWVFIPFIWWMCLISRAPPPPATAPPRRRRSLRTHRPRAPPLMA
ncbi:DUF2946 domain-containing protein [Pantoea sp. Eser]|nr:DUF2946 domain-containing protein [Pantoea sp. Eser]